jgi:hypothetical protein
VSVENDRIVGVNDECSTNETYRFIDEFVHSVDRHVEDCQRDQLLVAENNCTGRSLCPCPRNHISSDCCNRSRVSQLVLCSIRGIPVGHCCRNNVSRVVCIQAMCTFTPSTPQRIGLLVPIIISGAQH